MLRWVTGAFILAGLTVAAVAQTPQLSPEEGEQGFVPLFNGRDLSGWQVIGAPSWKVEDGVLVCTGEGGGWLRTDKQYENFVLRLEYKISPRGNSGIFLRATERGNPAFSGMEIQILDDHGREPNKGSSGAIYAAVAPAKNMSKPAGEWNRVEIICSGRWLVVTWNGAEIMRVDLSDDSIDTGGHPKLSQRARKGYLGLQNHGARVEFRRIRLKELP